MAIFAVVAFGLNSITLPSWAKRVETHVLSVPEASFKPIVMEPDLQANMSWHEVTVESGQSLAAIFASLGLTASDVHRIVTHNDDTAQLSKIFPGDVLKFGLDNNGELAALESRLDEASVLKVRVVDGLVSSEIEGTELVAQIRHVDGVIVNSLFLAGRQAGLSDPLILNLAKLFAWDIDFVLDIRSGDSFQLIYEEMYRDGEFVRTGDIVAATFVNQGEKYQAIRFDTGDGYSYFSPDGRNMRKAFLRAPLEFTGVNSAFNPRRLHPVTGTIKAHRGIDYGAAVGTPVYAAGDGTVTQASYNQFNGNYVFIRHPNGIVTKYLHFSKKAVRKGEKVRQGDVIGYVGATGRVTGAHLHYEFIVDGVHRNPATVKLPKADALPPAKLADFKKSAAPLLAQLDRLQARRMLAEASP